jgi:hypothetical protein
MDFKWTTRDEKLLVVDYWWMEQQGLCCVCHESMKPYRRQHTNDPEAATVEHLIPKRDGGPDTVDNVRLAHARCNHALGGLWSLNQHRTAMGLPPLSEKWALNTAKGNRRAAEKSALQSMTAEENARRMKEYQARKERGIAWCAANALSLPRGATLLPENQAALGIIVRNRIARPKMTAIETAQWLKEKGIRGA